MKTERRHELQTNVLADWLGSKLETAHEYTKAILASFVAVAVIAGALIYMSQRSEQTRASAWEQYFNATLTGASEKLGTVADKYPDTLAGQWARLSLGDTELAQGTEQLFEDRTLAKGTLEQATESYTRAREQTQDVEILQRSTIGLARVHEALSQLGEARQEYEDLLAKWPKSIYATEARQRLDDISKQSTKEFYDWFASQNTKPFAGGGPGIPGLKPSGLPDSEPANSSPPANPPGKKPDATPATPETPAGAAKAPPDKPAAAAPTPPATQSAAPAAAPTTTAPPATAPPAASVPPASAPPASTPPAADKPPESKK